MSEEMARTEAIKTLKEHLSHWERLLQEHICEEQEGIDTISALKLAIASLETDEAYQLEYESTTKSDLGVDWENYKDLDGNSLDDLILEVLQNNFDCGNTYGYKVADEIIGLLPSVTPQEPIKEHCKDCKWWKDSDGEYRRGCEAESICRINTDKVYRGEGYCYLFEPQESEVEK